ncbi:MAG: glycosyltransferase family 4 protein [Desertimonas sp.]
MAPPLRIGMVSPYSLTEWGGVQAQVLGLCRELRRLGHEARLLGPCDGPPPEPFVTPLGNSLPTAANGSIAPLAPDAPAALRTIRALYDEGFDVVHLHEPLAPGPTVTALLMHIAPTVGTFHAAGRSTGYQVFRGILGRWLDKLDRRVVVSKDALELVDAYLPGDYDVLFNGVEVDAIARAEPAPCAEPTILFLGRHEERKGLAVLLEAMAQLPETVRLWVIGDGPDTATLRDRFDHDGRIAWLGRVSDAEKFARLRGATAFCAPSLHGESFGVVLIEAMAAGTPVVASSLDGYRNVATDELDSLLVPPGDVTALAGALGRVLADHALAERLRVAGRARAEEFSMRSLALAYVDIYRQMIDAAGGDQRRPGRRLARVGRRLVRGVR